MKMPIFGKVLNLFGQFARTLSTLLENGVPVLTALKITEQIIPNSIVKEAIAKTRGSHRRQDHRPTAGAQQSLPPTHGGPGQDRRGYRRSRAR